jgi:phthiocerol/phenolphthiocerol synthesis type-I polyketide synthase C
VLRPKMLGAWHLDRLTRDRTLDFFILYSSAASLFGNPGQSNYAAANLYLEALAEQRRGAGLPALVMQWGAIGEVGHIARSGDVAKIMTERLGVRLIPPRRAFERLEEAIVGGLGQVAVADLDWSKLAHMPQLAKSPKYGPVRPAPGAPDQEGEPDAARQRERLAAMPPAQRYQYVKEGALKQLAAVLRMPVAKLGIEQSLTDLGMDSLMVVEFQMAVEQQFGISVPTLEFMDVVTVGQLVGRIADQLGVEPIIAADALPLNDVLDVDALPADALDEVLATLLQGTRDPTKEGSPP